MIGVAEDDVGAGFLELSGGEGFHVGQRPHRHKAGGRDPAVGGNEIARPRLRVGAGALANKSKSRQGSALDPLRAQPSLA